MEQQTPESLGNGANEEFKIDQVFLKILTTNGELRGSESYEEVSEGLRFIEGWLEFRRSLRGRGFDSFVEAIEVVSLLNRFYPDNKELFNKVFETLTQRAHRFSKRVADLFLGMLNAYFNPEGPPYESYDNLIKGKVEDLARTGEMELLFSGGGYPWQKKRECFEASLLEFLKCIAYMDFKEGEKMEPDIVEERLKEIEKIPKQPPGRMNSSKPGVDPMERLTKGEQENIKPWWIITPPWGGYYRTDVFHHWDPDQNMWYNDENEYVYQKVRLRKKEDPKRPEITLQAEITAGSYVEIPMPYNYGVEKIDIDDVEGDRKFSLLEDQFGNVCVLVEGEGTVPITVTLVPLKEKELKKPEPTKPLVIPAKFSEETEKFLQSIPGNLSNIEKARKVLSYIMRRIRYLAPKSYEESERYNQQYNSDPERGFAGMVDEIREGDCDVVNTYFAALCSRLGIPVRHVVGFMVQGKWNKNSSIIHRGCGHAWSEVWDEKNRVWLRMDATPPGDPQREESEIEGEGVPGDYGEREAIAPSEEELEKLRKELETKKIELSYTEVELSLAKEAGISPAEAREILREIQEVDNTKLPDGRRIVDVLGDFFNLLVEKRRKKTQRDVGPVRRREGGDRIIDLVRHLVELKSGEPDPMSRERIKTEEKEEKLFGGFDVYFVCDRSGSMEWMFEGQVPWKFQRKVLYLILSSLYRLADKLKAAHLSSESSLDVRTQVISFINKDKIVEDKPLSREFSSKDKVRLWKSLSEVGMGNGDLAAIQYLYGEIKKEIEAHPEMKNRLRIIIAFSDGGYVGQEAEMKDWAEKLSEELGVVVVGIGLTNVAKTVPVVLNNPPKSFGEIVDKLENLPYVVAKHIVLQAIKLFPQKAQDSAILFLKKFIDVETQ